MTGSTDMDSAVLPVMVGMILGIVLLRKETGNTKKK